MFDLEQAIAGWRQQMLAAGIKSPAPMEELESHLRDEIEVLARSGLKVEAAFQKAAQKIGPAGLVQNEFKKVKTADREWKLSEIGMVVVSLLLPLKVGHDLIFKGGGLTHDQQLSGLAAMAVFLLLCWGGRLSYRAFPVISARRIRSLICVAGFVLAGLGTRVFLTVIVPAHDYTISQTVVGFIWAWSTPMGVVAGTYWGIETAARKKIVPAGS